MNQMKQMMQQMGIDIEEIDASEVVIKRESGDNIKFDNPDVNEMDAQGQTIHQVMGEPEYVDNNSSQSEDNESSTQDDTDDETDEESGVSITEEDVNIVSLRAGVSEDKAREKLEENDGDLAKSISDLD